MRPNHCGRVSPISRHGHFPCCLISVLFRVGPIEQRMVPALTDNPRIPLPERASVSPLEPAAESAAAVAARDTGRYQTGTITKIKIMSLLQRSRGIDPVAYANPSRHERLREIPARPCPEPARR